MSVLALNLYISPTPILVTFIGVAGTPRPSPQQTTFRSPIWVLSIMFFVLSLVHFGLKSITGLGVSNLGNYHYKGIIIGYLTNYKQ